LRARRELTSIVLAIWLVTLKTSPWKVLRRREEMEAAAICPAITVTELMLMELAEPFWTCRESVRNELILTSESTNSMSDTMRELTERLLTSCSRTVKRSPARVLTVKELMEARSV